MLIWLNLVGGHGARRAEHASDSLRRIPTERRQEADGKRLLLTPRSLALPPARKSGIQMQPVNSRLVYLLFLVCLLFFSTSILIYHPLVCSNSASYVRLQFFSFACTPHFQKGFDGAFFLAGLDSQELEIPYLNSVFDHGGKIRNFVSFMSRRIFFFFPPRQSYIVSNDTEMWV